MEKTLKRAAGKVKSDRIKKHQSTRQIWNAASSGPYPKKIAIMGSTGSIGLNALKIARDHPDKFDVRVLAVRQNVKQVVAQAKEFRPKLVCVFDADKALEAEKLLKPYKIKVAAGLDGLKEAAKLSGIDTVLFAMVGAVGLIPIFEAIKAGKEIAVANKEPLVMAGELLMSEAQKRGVAILPIDSEHSGLWQCLEASRDNHVSKLVLTSSGGPFRTHKGSLENVSLAQALNHPKWKMGPKITVDSATLMNKGLEVIEAANLFEIPCDKIEVLVHPEAIIHAMVEFEDGSHLAQLGITDMRLPIQYALSYPERLRANWKQLDLTKIGSFNFEKPDMKRFPCLALGYQASAAGGTMPAVLNAANEVVVEAFLRGEIGFMDIPRKLKRIMKKHRVIKKPSLAALLDADLWARSQAEALL